MFCSLTDVCVSSCLLARVCMSCMRDSNTISLHMFKAHEISEPQLHNENRRLIHKLTEKKTLHW